MLAMSVLVVCFSTSQNESLRWPRFTLSLRELHPRNAHYLVYVSGFVLFSFFVVLFFVFCFFLFFVFLLLLLFSCTL